MGDRANTIIAQKSTISHKSYTEALKDGAVVFYTHWNGAEMPSLVQQALAKRWRWNDGAYLARIIWDVFCTERDVETGFGISTHICDNEHPLLVVDPESQTVALWDDDGGELIGRWTFEQFVRMGEEALQVIYEK